ncbi:MAG: hypothetical protein AAGJ31_07540, partial [Verrucomicrobiota bacterium]
KTRQGSVYYDSRNVGQMISIEQEGNYPGGDVDQTMLNQVIHLRIRETFELLKRELVDSGIFEPAAVGAGVYLTGGGALLNGVQDLAKAVFGIPVANTAGSTMSGNRTSAENPQYATAIGLIRYAQLIQQLPAQKGPLSNFGSRLGGWLGKAS